jgi:hypothetical protein
LDARLWADPQGDPVGCAMHMLKGATAQDCKEGKMRKNWMAALMVGSAVLLGLGARAEAKSSKEACKDWSQLQESVSNLQQMSPNSTIAQHRQAEQTVAQNLQQLAASAQKAAPQETNAVKESLRQLERNYQNMPANATIAESQDILQRDVNQVRSSVQSLKMKLGCK